MSDRPIQGHLDGRGLKFALIVSRFNSVITDRLLEGALDALERSGCERAGIEIVKVPGSWEMPVVAAEIARQKRHDGIICLGAVVRGDTPHFDYVAGGCANGLAQIARESGIPVAFAVLTTNTMEQATDRAGGKSGNKGFDAALTAIEMANLMKRLRSGE